MMAPNKTPPLSSGTQTPSGADHSKDASQCWLIDADAHLDPRYEMWKEYLPTHLREHAPYVEEGRPGFM